MDIEERVKKPEYQNWVKGTLALIHICDSVRVYTQHVFKQFQQGLKDGSHFENGFNASWLSGSAKWNEKTKSWSFPASVCEPCENLFKEVIKLHLLKDKFTFDNCKKIEVPGYWGIAKMFMSGHCQNVKTPDDTEPAALFKMMKNCGLFPLSHSNIETIIKARNDMMHSLNNLLSFEYTKTFFDAVEGFLQEASSNLTGNCKDVKTCLDKARHDIEELSNAVMVLDVMSNKAKTALDFKRKNIIQQISNIRNTDENAKELEKFYTILEDLRGEVQFWNRHSWEVGIRKQMDMIRFELNQARREIKELKDNLRTELKSEIAKTERRLSEETNRIKTEIEKIKEDHNKTKQEFREDLEKTNEQTEKLLRGEIDNSNREIDSLKDDLCKTQTELNDANDRTEKRLLEETGQAKKDLQDLKDDLGKTKKELYADHEMTKTQVKQLFQEEIEKRSREMESLRDNLTKRNAELQENDGTGKQTGSESDVSDSQLLSHNKWKNNQAKQILPEEPEQLKRETKSPTDDICFSKSDLYVDCDITNENTGNVLHKDDEKSNNITESTGNDPRKLKAETQEDPAITKDQAENSSLEEKNNSNCETESHRKGLGETKTELQADFENMNEPSKTTFQEDQKDLNN